MLNGAGELTGSLQIGEWGCIETPVYLTSTMAVGRVYDGAVTAAVAADSSVGTENFVIPVVGECDDGWLNDARTVQVEAADVQGALDTAGEEVVEGAVGAGTGMICFGWKGGIGTASRRIGADHLGVLALTNFGTHDQLRVDGVPVGRLLDPPPPGRDRPGLRPELVPALPVVGVLLDLLVALPASAAERSVPAVRPRGLSGAAEYPGAARTGTGDAVDSLLTARR